MKQIHLVRSHRDLRSREVMDKFFITKTYNFKSKENLRIIKTKKRNSNLKPIFVNRSLFHSVIVNQHSNGFSNMKEQDLSLLSNYLNKDRAGVVGMKDYMFKQLSFIVL